jgi:hypothetical protein
VIDELRRELEAAGVRGSWARRALDEAREHLAELGPERADAFGDPGQVAAQIAAVLGTRGTRRAAWAAFAALALTGIAYVTGWALVADAGQPDIASGNSPAVGVALTLALFFLPQVTFVAGVLMLWRAVRLPTPAPAAELRVVRRRAFVALIAAVATAGAWVLYMQQFDVAHGAAIVAAAGVATAGLVGAAARVRAAGRPQVSPEGTAGALAEDLEPILARTPFPGLAARPWRFALAFAGAVGLFAVAVGWNAEGTLADGLVRGIPEAVAVLAFYAALGRALALRR